MKRIDIDSPLEQYTPFKSLLLSVASTCEGYNDWLNCHFINIYFKQENTDDGIPALIYFQDIPECLEIRKIPRKVIVSGWGTFSEFIKFSLGNNYCVCLEVDPYYIHSYTKYKKEHCHNTLLINGYDNNKNFNIAGFFYYPDSSFVTSTCCENDINEAIMFPDINDESLTWYNEINIIKPNGNDLYFSIDVLKNGLKLYLEGKNNKDSNRENIMNNVRNVEYDVSGISIYQSIIDLLEHPNLLNRYIFDSLSAHKEQLKSKYDYVIVKGLVEKNDSLCNNFENIINLSHKIKENAREYIITPTVELKKILKNDLFSLQESEIYTLNKFFDVLGEDSEK